MALLKNRNYLLLRTGWSVSSLGTQLQSFAFSLYVLAVTGSATQFSVTLCMEVLPMILFAPLCGYLSDRFDRKKQVIGYDLLCAATVFAFYFLDRANGKLEIYQIYTCVFLLSSFSNFMSASATGLIQSSVDPADYTKQKSVDTTISNLIAVFAPALAGILYGLSDIRAVMLLNGISFLFSSVMEGFLRRTPRSTPQAAAEAGGQPLSFTSSMREGLTYIRKSPFIRSFLLVLSALNFLLSAVGIGVTVVAQQTLRLDATAIGTMNSVLSAGMLAGAVFCGLRSSQMEKLSMNRLILTDLSAVAVSFFLTGAWLLLLFGRLPISANIGVFTVLNLIVMVANSILSVNLSARFQKIVPNEIMGRVGTSVNAVLSVCVPLGQVIAGFLMGTLPYYAVYFAEGAATLLLFAVCFKNSRKPAIMEPETPEESLPAEAAPGCEPDAAESGENAGGEEQAG